jgi:hypothetical protein
MTACNPVFGTEVLQIHQGRVKISVTEDQIRETVKLALEKFQRGVGFKSLAIANQQKGRISRSPIGDVVWEALEKAGVIDRIHISGVDGGGIVISESPNLEEDALLMKNFFQ